ncbi:hypothetical protein PF70_06774, partial [Pseudomonas asplenii]
FDLEPCRFQPAAALPAVPLDSAAQSTRNALPDWFHQRQWVRLRRLGSGSPH